jgi:hypothetical protein
VPAGIRRRRIGGWVGLAIAIALFVVLMSTAASPAWRIVLFVPLMISATGFFQAREKTCVALGMAGKREMEGGGTCPLQQDERAAVSAHVRKVFAESFVVAAIVTAMAVFA